MKNITEKGFTLVELLIVIAIIAILAGAVVVTINPGEQFAQARNSTRRQHINSISNAVMAFAADPQHAGNFPSCIKRVDSEEAEEGLDWGPEQGTPIENCFDADGDDNVDPPITDELTNQLSEMPEDPDPDATYYLRIVDNNVEITSNSVEWVNQDDEE